MSALQGETLIAELRKSAAWPEEIRPSRSAELRQTHISWLLFTDEHVLKVKKPVDFDFLDFTTLERRRHFCLQEVELNRRLSPDVYRGVLAVRRSEDGVGMVGPLDDDGSPDDGDIEYGVLMRRLPEDGWLDRRLDDGSADSDLMRRVARRIAEFHAEAETDPKITRIGSLETVRENSEENFEQTRDWIGITVERPTWDAVKAFSEAFLEVRRPQFRSREERGRIRDGHGDLHTAQICVDDGIHFIDCIEFNHRFRCADVAADLAFTAMDVDFHGHPELSAVLVDAYVAHSGDRGLRRVLDYYLAYRAYTRGKVESLRLHQLEKDQQEDGQEWRRRRADIVEHAGRYFELAHLYARPPAPLLVVVCGLMGTGKTTLADGLRPRLRAHVASSDRVRKRLAGLDPEQSQSEEWGAGIYSDEFTERTYEELLRRAEEGLERGEIVVLDASFKERRWRRRAVDTAHDANAPVILLEATCPEEEVRHRLQRRQRSGDGPSDGRLELLDRQRDAFEAPDTVERSLRVEVDTTPEPDRVCYEALQRIHARLL